MTTFDAHQDVDYARIPVVICRDPARLGMVTDRNGRWMRPASDADRARLAVLGRGQ